jgi:hypothetical protein
MTTQENDPTSVPGDCTTSCCAGETPARPLAASAGDVLNDGCFCISLDRDALADALAAELGDRVLADLVRERCPHVFSDRPVFVADAQVRRIQDVIHAVEDVAARPAWRESALADAPAIARHDPGGARGVFFGYDFHLSGSTLGLIEINTNAGGAMLNAVLARAQRACCDAVRPLVPTLDDVDGFERAIVAMFRSEWRAAGSDEELRCVAIVDDAPERQYLYPEFLLFQRLLTRHGIRTVVADPGELELRDGALHHGDARIDLVYNRLTDFYLEGERCATLRDAYLRDAVVLTPHPQAHAMFADKRRLVALTDPASLEAFGVAQATRELLQQAVPRTELVHVGVAERMWERRRGLFFKPVAGYGSRAAYRGDKLTKRVWQQILAGGYVAQALVAPGERRVGDAPGAAAMKFDLRCYVYDGAIQWIAARVYQGQTTNFRTPGGGFAPVYTMPGELQGQPTAAAAPDFASYLFLLDDAGDVHPLPQPLYEALVRAEGTPSSLAGSTLRLADWYVQMRDGAPHDVVNEWYGWLRFGADGRVEALPARPPGPTPPDPAALPTVDERRRMMQLLFSPSSGTGVGGAEGTDR